MEIERKFLVERLPEKLDQYPHSRLEQAYLCTDPTLRVRRDGDQYIFTCKGRGVLAREEFELPLTEAAYRHLLTKAEGYHITKERYRIPLGAYTVELDVFAPPFAPLVYAEVEFPTVEEAESFQPPEWFGREVSREPGWSNGALSRNGLPEAFRKTVQQTDA